MSQTHRASKTITGLSRSAFDAILNRQDPAWALITNTPFLHSAKLSALTHCSLFIKFENLQYTGAFKERGALAKLSSLTGEERTAGVIAASAGNHAQGVARIAAELNIKTTIVMPLHTPFVKIQQTEALGAEVVLKGDDFDAANAFAHKQCQEKGMTFVHPFNDPYVMTGQGTIAAEMLAAEPDLDILLIPIGGGGLISGCAAVAKEIRPDINIIGVEAELYPSAYNAVKAVQSAPKAPLTGGMTLAEGIAVREPGDLTLPIIKELVDDILLVSERHLEKAVSLYLREQKVLSEGAGAAGLAAILAAPEKFAGKKVGTLICGGNIDTRLVSSILLRDLAREGRIARLRVELRDIPGQLTKVASIIADAGGNVIDVSYHRIFNDLPAKSTYIDISVEAHDGPHLNRIIKAFKENGLRVKIANY